MTNYDSTITFPSKIAKGVAFTLRKMSRGQRIAFNKSLTPINAQLRGFEREREPLIEKLDPIRKQARDAACTCEHPPERHHFETGMCIEDGCACREPKVPRDLLEQLSEIRQKELVVDMEQFQPALVRWGVAAIDGLVIDGKPADAEVLIASGDEALFAEVVAEISKIAGLTREETKNSDSPTTSGAVEDGEKIDSTVPSAESAATT